MDAVLRMLDEIGTRIERLEVHETPIYYGWTFLSTPLTSTSWDGDSFSTTAKTLIDLSAVFGAPASVKAVLVGCNVRDSGSAGTYSYLILSPTNTAGSGLVFGAESAVNDRFRFGIGAIPCDANGDVYYQTVASGASTLDIVIEIWGYLA
jgi:hypothetical protein